MMSKIIDNKQLNSFLNTNYSKRSISIFVESIVENDPMPSQVDVVVDPTYSLNVPVDVVVNPTPSVNVQVDVVVDPIPSSPVEVPVKQSSNHGCMEEDCDSGESTELENFFNSDYEEDDRLFDENMD